MTDEEQKKKKKRKFLNFGKSIIEIETTYIQREASERVKSYAAI